MNSKTTKDITHGIQLKILDTRIGSELPLPPYETEGAAGLDLRACIGAPATIGPGETVLISR